MVIFKTVPTTFILINRKILNKKFEGLIKKI